MTGRIDEATREEDCGLTPVEQEDAEAPPDAGAAEPSPEAQVSEVEQLRARVDELEALLLRKRAEFENFRRRTDRERADVRDLATAEVIETLLPTFDNLERAANASGDESSVREGLGLIMKEVQGFLDRHRLVADDPTGGHFDPERQQALSHEEIPGYSEGQIIDVFQKGYSIGERMIRPALVRVAKGHGEPEESGSPDGAEDE